MIGLIGALDIEVNGIKNLMTDKTEETVSKIIYTKGLLKGKACVVAQCGIGKVNAAVCAQTMILKYSPDTIINIGIAGGLDSKIDIGDIVLATNVVQHDMDGTALGDPLGEIWFTDEKLIYIPADEAIVSKLEQACKGLNDVKVFKGTIATGDQFISAKESRIRLNLLFGGLACEMEGGAIGQVCYRSGVAFGILRSISDNMENNEGMDFESFKILAANNSIAVVNSLFDLI
ncbi:MAG TPA: 5'-methylthioadenosine/adenosylhomocysteine nucleosidase [Clostridiales bacterium]|nr:5'-methylthioadenosine/adenosylhomocysteine nucleosidase [Clostridiales bacterium]